VVTKEASGCHLLCIYIGIVKSAGYLFFLRAYLYTVVTKDASGCHLLCIYIGIVKSAGYLFFLRAYLHTVVTKEASGCHLISVHNIAHQLNLMRKVIYPCPTHFNFNIIHVQSSMQFQPDRMCQSPCLHSRTGLLQPGPHLE
jgi:hypothetical protein